MKVQLLENNYDHATKMYKEKATLLHDEKHHIRTIQEFLERGDTAAAIKYAGEMTEKLERSGNRVWSKHSLVDMMLNMKIQEAEKNHIRMDVSFDDMEGLILKEMDICTLLSNALDNAIEANQKITDIKENHQHQEYRDSASFYQPVSCRQIFSSGHNLHGKSRNSYKNSSNVAKLNDRSHASPPFRPPY